MEPLFQIKPLEWKIVNENKCEVLNPFGYYCIWIDKQRVYWSCSRDNGKPAEHEAASVEDAKIDAWHHYRDKVEQLLTSVSLDELIKPLEWKDGPHVDCITARHELCTYTINTVRNLWFLRGEWSKYSEYHHVTADQAKQAAQAHLNALIQRRLLVEIRK